ncbi:MAG TPA: HRDC domain-containing protein [Kofleriaceae bacterium]|nr:HRDC domain-containing protein [Kofleriaceae bacterium]
MSALVAEPGPIEEIADALATAPLATFDLEFLAQDRLVPTLCLVQVSWLPAHMRLDVPAQAIVATPPEVALLDPLAGDVRPVIEALAHHPNVVAHAARQDLGIIASRFGIAMPAITDTQVMAAFAGAGDQVGLATLANELLGLVLGKEHQWTDWSQRPLSDAQLAYADADVRHLPAIYAKLAARLGNRLPWARAESSLVAADAVAAASVTPETAWRTIGGTRGMDAAQLAALRELAAWRHRVAIELDRPLGWVVSEKSLVELARQRPGSVEAIRGTKGISQLVRQRASEVLAALQAAKPDDSVVPVALSRAPSSRAQRWSEALLAIVQLVAEQTGVAARLLATRADAEEFARAVDEGGIEAARGLPALATWRHEVIGKLWVDWLGGSLALVGDVRSPLGVSLVPR